MLDRLYLPLLGAVTLLVIALAMVWPQGLGARSPGPFGHTPVQQTPEMKAKILREHNAAQERDKRARDAIRELQTQAIAPSQ
ncbi:hypothetical protein [Phenylobacterium sp.]|jgi:hypothetical protein|uniref:hypothetical protein n=1 Tax=Phenylobacterium sp. TaxID=1871053 RepID=UPI002F921012